jgi:hypothetical protein
MTEQTAPFGGLAVADPQPAFLPEDAADDTGSDNRRKLAVVGAAVGVVVLLVAAFFLLKGGDETVAPVAPQAGVPVAGQSDGGNSQAGADKPVKLPKSYSEPVGRDPFKAQYTAPVAAKADSSDETTTDKVETPEPTDGVTVGAPTATATAPVPVWVELVRVNGDSSATFIVAFNDGSSLKTEKFRKVKTPDSSSDGTVFAGVFALLDVHDGVATIQYGDGTPLSLTPGPGSRLVVS